MRRPLACGTFTSFHRWSLLSSLAVGGLLRPCLAWVSPRTTPRTFSSLPTPLAFRSNSRHRSSPNLYPRVSARRMVQGVAIEDGCLVNTNPATGEVLSRVPVTPLTDIDGIVATAQKAQIAWAALDAEERVALIRKGLAQLATKKDVLCQWIVKEMGKPLAQAEAEMDGAVDKEEYLDLLLKALEPKQHGSSLVLRQPYGVVVVNSPWNFPADEILLLALPALGSGNTVIVKPSEVAPETGQLVVETLAAVLPPGVLQVVQGAGAVGAALTAHSGTRLICMTGSTATGKTIAQTAASSLKRVVLELGGKDPLVVMADADLESAAKDAVAYSLDNTGQVCCSVERVYVAEAIYDDFAKRVAELAAEYKVGNGMDPDVNVGPLVSAMQKAHVEGHVKDAVDKGASLIYQGKIPENAPEAASFFPVTVISQVEEGMKMYREETFGPVVSLTKFDGSEEAAVRLANDTNYGLAAAVYSQDLAKAQRVASRIQAGQVGINCYSLDHMDYRCPWVGHKDSGLGYHSGVEGFHNFSIPQSLVFKP